MTTLTPDIAAAIAACRAAVDAGDDTGLLGWADALEESGQDGLAAGLRESMRRGYRPAPATGDKWLWLRPDTKVSRRPYNAVPPQSLGVAQWAVPLPSNYRHLGTPGQSELLFVDGIMTTVHAKAYPSRSAAYLALAQALTQ